MVHIEGRLSVGTVLNVTLNLYSTALTVRTNALTFRKSCISSTECSAFRVAFMINNYNSFNPLAPNDIYIYIYMGARGGAVG